MMAEDMAPVQAFEGPIRSLAVDFACRSVRMRRVSATDLGPEVMLYSEPDDALALIYQIADMAPHDLWLGGRYQAVPSIGRGTLQILPLNERGQARIGPGFDSLNIRIPRALLRDITWEAADMLSAPANWSVRDAFVSSLEPALLHMVEQHGTVDPLAAQQVVAALLTHLAVRFGTPNSRSISRPGTLAPWQLRRAEELLAGDLENSVSLAELAQACDLSVSHFSRAFRATTGKSPFAWLTAVRLDAAKQMLRSGAVPIAEIALRCGFANQSHFTRIFTRHIGAPPKRWCRAAG